MSHRPSVSYSVKWSLSKNDYPIEQNFGSYRQGSIKLYNELKKSTYVQYVTLIEIRKFGNKKIVYKT
jgi:hypothetical protein